MVTRYFIYGVSLPLKWKREWEERYNAKFQDTFLEFRDTFWKEGNNQSNGIIYPYKGRDGEAIIIGIVLKRKWERNVFYNPEIPIQIPELNDNDKKKFEDALKYFFYLKEGFHYFYVINKDS